MNQITIDGKVYNLVPVEEETEVETKEETKPTGWERVTCENEQYNFFSAYGDCLKDDDMLCVSDEKLYDYGNYFTDKQLAKDMARATSLWLKLHRFAAENQTEKIDWNDVAQTKWSLWFDFRINEFDIAGSRTCCNSMVYFDSRETAEKAIEKFKDELTWYFTQFTNTRRFEK